MDDLDRKSTRRKTNAQRLQEALTLLTQLDQLAEQRRLHGQVSVTIHYQSGQADRIEENVKASYR